MVGIDVLTMVASMANKKMTSMTPAVAKIRLESALWDGSSEKFTLRSQVENFLLLLSGFGKT
jgi:hypothetical protein